MLYRIIFFFFFILSGLAAHTQESTEISEPLIIGITETPPFIIKENGKYKGLSISSWELVNEKLNADFRFRTYPSLISLLEGIENGEVDFSINPITVTDSRMKRLDFSQPYFISYTGVAKNSETKIWKYLANIFSWNFISGILILVGVIFIFGFLIWLFERKKNREEFGKPGIRGIFQGFWWSAVTMTTVGYGDKSPKTPGGRFFAMIWMFIAIITISSLTAGISSSLTVQKVSDEIRSVEDLNRFNVITVAGSSAEELLDQYHVVSEKVYNAKDGIQKILEKERTVFVYDKPILKYQIDRLELVDEIEVIRQPLKRDYFSYSFPNGSELLGVINPLLIATLKTMEWDVLLKEYQ
ncbi:MAG TPA: transporter substrate-binding domain-containing protein [Salinimicrobium sp.]|nr:transporter substrate-binding domain-containing protein [Salinimicrobium sp.]